MLNYIKKHPFVTAAAALAAAWAFGWIKVSTASAQPQPQPQPPTPIGPNPAPPAPPAPLPTMQTIVLAPGSASLSLPSGSGFTLQLPTGASWPPTLAGTSPVMQPPGSVLGGTVNPLAPTGNESQVWTNVTGNGSLVVGWIDASGKLQTATLTVNTTGGAHVLGS
jgi:hypothetical protein